jgi:hypothetical protein
MKRNAAAMRNKASTRGCHVAMNESLDRMGLLFDLGI